MITKHDVKVGAKIGIKEYYYEVRDIWVNSRGQWVLYFIYANGQLSLSIVHDIDTFLSHANNSKKVQILTA